MLLWVPALPTFIYEDHRVLTKSHKVTVGTVSWGTVSGYIYSKGLVVFVVLEI